jgi:phage baseplate assembly protein W
LLPVPDGEGRLAWPDPARSVREKIEAILRTAPGEQLMRPRFGAGMERLIDRPNTLTTRAEAHDAVMAALSLYEKRILLDAVDVSEGKDPRELLVSIAYRLRPTGVPGRIEARVPVGVA